jgi:hypothetical protein
VADFNGDGALDVATVNHGASTVSVLLNASPAPGPRPRAPGNRTGAQRSEVPGLAFTSGGSLGSYGFLLPVADGSRIDQELTLQGSGTRAVDALENEAWIIHPYLVPDPLGRALTGDGIAGGDNVETVYGIFWDQPLTWLGRLLLPDSAARTPTALPP